MATDNNLSKLYESMTSSSDFKLSDYELDQDDTSDDIIKLMSSEAVEKLNSNKEEVKRPTPQRIKPEKVVKKTNNKKPNKDTEENQILIDFMNSLALDFIDEAFYNKAITVYNFSEMQMNKLIEYMKEKFK